MLVQAGPAIAQGGRDSVSLQGFEHLNNQEGVPPTELRRVLRALLRVEGKNPINVFGLKRVYPRMTTTSVLLVEKPVEGFAIVDEFPRVTPRGAMAARPGDGLKYPWQCQQLTGQLKFPEPAAAWIFQNCHTSMNQAPLETFQGIKPILLERSTLFHRYQLRSCLPMGSCLLRTAAGPGIQDPSLS